MTDHQVFIFGHSMVLGRGAGGDGWAERLKRCCMGKNHSREDYYEAYVLGVADEDSGELLGRFEQEIENRLYDGCERLVIVQTGMNDLQFAVDREKFRVPREKFLENMESIIKKAENCGEVVILSDGYTSLEGTVPGFENMEMSDEVLADYVNSLEELCGDRGVRFINLRREFKEDKWERHLVDSFHPDTNIHEMIFEKVEEYLEKNSII